MAKISDYAAQTNVLETDEYIFSRSGVTYKIDAVDLRAGLGKLTWPAIGYPSGFAATPDCDFDGSLGNYTAVGTSSGTVNLLETTTSVNKYDLATKPGFLLVQVGNAQVAEFRSDYTIADGESMTIAVMSPGPPTGDNMAVALRLNESSDVSSQTGNWIACMIESDTTEWVFQGNASDNATGGEINTVSMFAAPFALLRIVRSGTTYSCWVSLSGGAWFPVFERTGVATPYANVWISITGSSTNTVYVPIHAIAFAKKGTSGYAPW